MTDLDRHGPARPAWAVEVFHKVPNSDCQAERAKFRTAGRPTNLPAVLRVVGRRVFWLRMAGRAAPDAPADAAFTPAQVTASDRIAAGVMHRPRGRFPPTSRRRRGRAPTWPERRTRRPATPPRRTGE